VFVVVVGEVGEVSVLGVATGVVGVADEGDSKVDG